ncbi:alpha-2C adrenergic receptor [Stomoxys calcitrans]|uniref:alpha-2C adrenergic receptor n=1 Tax=Stomoxys calcitrans TaxID=35570 RepID=UPI0027E34733|nr:alpha-2C adrenergic receptor [Stomoxys calcitrans]
MDYNSELDNTINTGNISTDDFLAIFTSTTTTASPNEAGGGPGGGLKGGGGGGSHSNANVTMNPPLVTVDGQYTVTSLLDSAFGITAPTPTADINDTLFLLSSSFYNTSANGAAAAAAAAAAPTINLTSSTTTQFGNYFNQSFGGANLTSNITEVHWDGRYPSGYTLTHIVIASIIVTILMIVIIVGNMLVIIAIATEKSLKNIQNWFIASLAVADFFLGLIIMPFSLANELMGYWIFGSWWCDIHSAMDVLLCTSSIMNLCLISLDRYWSITKAVDYLKSRTPARAALMIAAVWIMSALICIPPLLGWKVKMPEGPLPKCALSEDIGYVLYSALGSFYIPSCIMVFVYIRIYFAAKARARRGIKKHPRKTNNEQVTSFTNANKKGTIPMPSSSAGALQKHQQHQIATIETPPNSAGALPMQIPTVTCDLASDISTSEAAEMEPHPLMYPNAATVGGCSDMAETALSPTALETPTTNNLTSNCNDASSLRVSTITTAHGALNVPVPPSMAANNNSTTTAALNNNNNGTLPTTAAAGTTLTATTTLLNTKPTTTLSAATNELKVSPIAGRCRALSVGIDTDMVSEFDPSSSDSGVVSRCAVVKPLKFRLCQPIFGRKSNNRRQNEAKAAAAAAAAAAASAKDGGSSSTPTTATTKADIVKAELEPAIPKPQKPRDPEKEKRRIARKKEKRATLILGLIMGSFIACWLPFFFLYILMPACSTHCHIPDSAFAIAFWLGYMNSALNPAIYTIFNKDFRRAFRRILFK